MNKYNHSSYRYKFRAGYLLAVIVVLVASFYLLFRPRTDQRAPLNNSAVIVSTSTEYSAPLRVQPTDTICDPLNAVCISSNYVDSILDNPWHINETLANSVRGLGWEIFDGSGKSLGGVSGGPGMHLTGLQSTIPQTTTGTLILSAGLPNPKNIESHGLIWTRLRIPVRFPEQRMNVKIFVNSTNNKDCTAAHVNSFEIPQTSKPIEAALRVILWQATENVIEEGPAITSIPQGTNLNSAVLSNGVLKLEFSKELENVATTSCEKMMIRDQIERIVKQFGTVQRVEISVPGKTPEQTLK